jgi:hypothetical protein
MKHIAIPTFIVLLVSVVITDSGHAALAYNNHFTRDSNSGNSQQDCGNSCTVTSSNAISGSGVSLTPTLIPTPTQSSTPSPTRVLTHSSLTLSVTPALQGGVILAGRLTTNGSGVSGATITFTGRDQFGDAANLEPTAVTDINGKYRVTLSGSLNFIAVAAQFAGEGIGASQSGDKSVPAH